MSDQPLSYEPLSDGWYCVNDECLTHIDDMSEADLESTHGHCWTCWAEMTAEERREYDAFCRRVDAEYVRRHLRQRLPKGGK
jgi:hypothetical protein